MKKKLKDICLNALSLMFLAVMIMAALITFPFWIDEAETGKREHVNQ